MGEHHDRDHHHHHDHGHGHGDGHGRDHRAHDHSPRRDGGPRDERGRGGPPGTAFLQLEMSQVLAGEAERIARDAAVAILRDAVRARLEERLGDRLRAVAQLVADDLADDIEANLEIESLIGARREKSKDLSERVKRALARG